MNSEMACRAFSHDVTAAMLVFQNKGMAAMMVYQTNPPGIDGSLAALTRSHLIGDHPNP